MKWKLIISLWLLAGSIPARADVFLIYYATYQGKTGHVGLAVDNYRILIREEMRNGRKHVIEDTLATGELTYYDLWPREDSFSLFNTTRDLPAAYFQLPVSSTEEITLNQLYDRGIPHKEYYPCDGILRISTRWREDDRLREIMDSLARANRPFNARTFNCTDFVIVALEELMQIEIRAREFVLVGMVSTPNALYRELRKMKEITIVKNADAKCGGSFVRERIRPGAR